jgi:hypothetical protein
MGLGRNLGDRFIFKFSPQSSQRWHQYESTHQGLDGPGRWAEAHQENIMGGGLISGEDFEDLRERVTAAAQGEQVRRHAKGARRSEFHPARIPTRIIIAPHPRRAPSRRIEYDTSGAWS